MTTTRATAAAAAEVATTMTDRWDTLPGPGETPTPAAAKPAPTADASPHGDAPGAAEDAAATTRDTPRRVDAVSPPGGDAPRPRVDHDAPTAKLPALTKQAPRKREPIKKPGPFPVMAGSAGLFFAIAALLAFQMRAGADPALGKPKPVVVAQATPEPRKVLIRRVIVTRIVEHRPRRGATRTTTPAASGSGAAPAPSAPQAAAPAPAAPAPAPAAPAPAPAAPLTTQSS